MKYKINIENLTKILDQNKVLDNINLEFKEGKIYGIIGRNGSGKSLLFKTICGFLTPTSGKVYINDIDIYQTKTFPPSTRALIEKPNSINSLTGFENLKLLADIKKDVGIKEIEDTLVLVNLQNEKSKKFGKYSLGMKQKLGIASVLMENPKIIILDEPFNGIDKSSIQQIKDYLLKIKSDKIILIASHIESDISDLCDEIIEMDLGKINWYNFLIKNAKKLYKILDFVY